ncbi:hypothetical protein ARHIZOSPH14_21550 [Agromyces rhizosphaerae]|uniref:Uncharacterized protein n=1 Tax=Agromyces rhizosphaerae TaxID=88374 RepID=A0A9W6CSY3_9MICO|nr:hypothetical protein ARHIZOSPH14_21550 [Agromyces rhizosphaerae]
MSIVWDEYEPVVSSPTGQLETLPRVEARRLFEQCMESVPARLEALRRLLAANGVELTSSDASIRELNEWFITHVEAHPDLPGRLHPSWESICHDVALFLGEAMIERHSNLRWEFFIWGRTNVAYQRHVIMGFGTEDPKRHTNLDIDRSVTAYAHRIVESGGSVSTSGSVCIRGTEIDVDLIAAQHRMRDIDPDAFLRWLRSAARRA